MLSIWLLAATAALTAAPRDLTRHVNVFIGTGGHGHTYPGATVPFGMVQLSPDTFDEGWDWCSGYHTSDSSIMGFSHTHLSGTGVGDMQDILLMPGTGRVKLVPGSREKPEEGYRSRFSHSDEVARPGYYSVLLKDYNIKAELTAAERAGLHRYTFPKSESSHFIIDMTHGYVNEKTHKTDIIDSQLKIEGNDTISGGRRVNGWAPGRHIYFVMKFSKPFKSAELAEGGTKAVVRYDTAAGEAILVKTGLSGVSVEGARKNLEKEIAAWDFDGIAKAAHDAWQRELAKITVESSNAKQLEIFYTGLYHTMLAPTLFDDVDGQYRGMDNEVHRAPQGLHNYSTFSLWDTYRAAHPLYTLMQGARVPDFISCIIRMAGESPAGMPVWPLQGRETGCMTGYHSVPVIAEAAVKGFKGIDLARVYPQIKKRALEDDYRGLNWYRKLGYIACDREEESATKTLEYSYDDWATAQIAKLLGKEEDYKFFLARSRNYRNLFDKSTGFIRPRKESGEWASPFDPKTTGTSPKWRDFTESNSWQGTWGAQHDPAGYIDLLGGREAFVKKLDDLFTQSLEVKGEVPVDMTGFVGMYAHGNEPSHHVAYLYAYAGAAYKTQERVRQLLEELYDNKPDGLSGNEDCGQMSAWYVMSALGFYAVDPAGGNYVFGTPLFDRSVVDMGQGRKLTIEAQRKSPADKYVQSVRLNGKAHDQVWFLHKSIASGGLIVFNMGNQPNKAFGTAAGGTPPSMGER